VTGRRGRRRRQLPDAFKEKRVYWKVKEEVLDRTVWSNRCGSGYGSVVRENEEWTKYRKMKHTQRNKTNTIIHQSSVASPDL
jgi:hypothetical protein